MTCKSSIPRKPNYDTSWCDGSDELAYEVEMGNRKQAISIRPGYDEMWDRIVTKIDHLPRDHWHAG